MSLYRNSSTLPNAADYAEEKLVDLSNREIYFVKSFIDQNNFKFQIVNIQKVNNYFMEALYELKKAEIRSRFTKPPKEHFLIHVTSANNVNNIVENNFDWRRTSRGKFGLGTSFADDALYANRYANFNIGSNRALIITKVLVSRATRGLKDQPILEESFDTSVGNNNKVYVKFYDNEMLPMFVIYYMCRNVLAPIHNVNQLLSSQSNHLGRQCSLSFLTNDAQSLQNINSLLAHQLVSSHSNTPARCKAYSNNPQPLRNVNHLLSNQLVHPSDSSARQSLPQTQPRQAREPAIIVPNQPTNSHMDSRNQYLIQTTVRQPIVQNNDNDSSWSMTKWVFLIIVIIIVAVIASQNYQS